MKIYVVSFASFAFVLAQWPTPADLSAADWPQFGRDGTRNAVSPERRAPTNWAVGKPSEQNPRERIEGTARNIKWSTRLGSSTYGDPVVADGLIWVGTNNQGNATDKLDASVLACYRERDGNLLYRYVSPRLPQGWVHDEPFSSMACSPYIEKDRIWFVTNRAEVVCLDIAPLHRGDGDPNLVWKVDLIARFGVFPRGSEMALARHCSIANHKSFIYVITGNGVAENNKEVPSPAAPSLICFDRNTGEAVWHDNSTGGNILHGQWSSPTIIEIDGRAQCIAPQGDGWVRSFDALTGKLIWQFDMNRKEGRWSLQRSTRHFILAAPVFTENRIYIATGISPAWGDGPGRLVCLDPTRQGDISSELAVDREGNGIVHRRIQAVDRAQGEKAIPNSNSGLVWEFTHVADAKTFNDTMHLTVSNVAVHKGLVIAPDSSGMVHCLDTKTGKRHWSHDLLTSITGSPLIVDETAYVATMDGGVAIFGLSPDPDVALRRLNGESQPLREIAMDSPIYCSPIFANGVLYVASSNELFAIADENDAPDTDLTAGYWPQWRGPNRDNASSEKGLLQEWPESGPRRLWTATGVGEGIASVSVAEGKIFTLGYQEESEFAVALEKTTGELSWATRIGPAVAENPLMRWLTQRSPTVDGERLYTMTAGGDLVCVTTAGGRELWRKSYPADFGARRPTWGFCDSPLVDGDRLICTPGGPQAKIVALDKRTGDLVWKADIPGGKNEGAGYAALVAAKIGGVRQFVTFLTGGLVGVAADDGRFLWRHDSIANGVGNTHTPLIRGDFMFCSSGWGQGIVLLTLIPQDGKFMVDGIYRRNLGLDGFQDGAALVDDHIFAGSAQGYLACIDWKTGERVWGTRKVSGRQAIVAADGCLYCRHSDGKVTLAQATAAEFVERGTFAIPDHQPALGATAPVIAGRRLYLRDNNRLHCYDIRADALQVPATEPRTISLAVPAAAARAGASTPANVPRENRPDKSIFVPTPHDVVKKMLDLAEVKKSDVVYDLGSGDGRIVIAAAKDSGCKAVGYELDPELVARSREQAKADGVEKLVTIEMADLFTADLAAADVVTLYLLPRQIEKLIPRLKKMKPGSRVVSHQFEIPEMKPEKSATVESKESGEKHTLYLYVLPR